MTMHKAETRTERLNPAHPHLTLTSASLPMPPSPVPWNHHTCFLATLSSFYTQPISPRDGIIPGAGSFHGSQGRRKEARTPMLGPP